MKKRGLILKLLGLIFILIILFIGAAIYFFYNIYTFKTIRVCIGEKNNTPIPCNTTTQCTRFFKIDETKKYLQEKQAPEIIQRNFNKIIQKSISCEQTCKIRTLRGINMTTMEIQPIESCKINEEEIKIEVKGKDLLKLLKFLKNIKHN